ncbi:MAG: Zn-ribbon containing protein [Candidatus Micrarchaeota archaeon]
MPHKCVRCGTVFDNKSMKLLNGCDCGSRVFLFLRDDQMTEEGKQAAPDVGWLEEELSFLAKEKPVSVDLDAVENLRILEQGAYELDLQSLMKGEPLVVKSDKDVYYIKMPSKPSKKLR